jgi:hypothetical protein
MSSGTSAVENRMVAALQESIMMNRSCRLVSMAPVMMAQSAHHSAAGAEGLLHVHLIILLSILLR